MIYAAKFARKAVARVIGNPMRLINKPPHDGLKFRSPLAAFVVARFVFAFLAMIPGTECETAPAHVRVQPEWVARLIALAKHHFPMSLPSPALKNILAHTGEFTVSAPIWARLFQKRHHLFARVCPYFCFARPRTSGENNFASGHSNRNPMP